MAAARRGLIAVGAALAGCGGGGGEPAPKDVGERVYAEQGCASCHVLAGKGGTVGPSLDARALTPAQIARWVRDGGTSMPAFGDRLSPADIAAVSRYVARASLAAAP